MGIFDIAKKLGSKMMQGNSSVETMRDTDTRDRALRSLRRQMQGINEQKEKELLRIRIAEAQRIEDARIFGARDKNILTGKMPSKKPFKSSFFQKGNI